MLRASAVAVPPEHWLTRASDASPSSVGLPTLAGCGNLPRSVGLRCSPSQPPRQTGGSDLCSRHQHASSGHSACVVIRVTQLCRIRQLLHQLARDAGLVALAPTRNPSNLRLDDTAWMQGALGFVAWVYLYQVASQCRKRAFPVPTSRWSRLELIRVQLCLAGVVLIAQADRGAVVMEFIPKCPPLSALVLDLDPASCTDDDESCSACDSPAATTAARTRRTVSFASHGEQRQEVTAVETASLWRGEDYTMKKTRKRCSSKPGHKERLVSILRQLLMFGCLGMQVYM